MGEGRVERGERRGERREGGIYVLLFLSNLNRFCSYFFSIIGVSPKEARAIYDEETLYDELLQRSPLVKVWSAIVDKGSRLAVQMSKRI